MSAFSVTFITTLEQIKGNIVEPVFSTASFLIAVLQLTAGLPSHGISSPSFYRTPASSIKRQSTHHSSYSCRHAPILYDRPSRFMTVHLITLTIKVPRYAFLLRRCYHSVYATRDWNLSCCYSLRPLRAGSHLWSLETFIPPLFSLPFLPFHCCPASEPATPLYTLSRRTPAPLSQHSGDMSLERLTAIQTATQTS